MKGFLTPLRNAAVVVSQGFKVQSTELLLVEALLFLDKETISTVYVLANELPQSQTWKNEKI